LSIFVQLIVAQRFADYEPEVDLVKQSNVQMPGVIPLKNDTYLCTSFPLNTEETNYLVGFDPIADMRGVHHVLLFGCEAPGSEDVVWNCGEMTHNGHSQESEKRSPTCSNQPNILYAWAHDAPKLELPKGVGFRVGGNTNNNYLVLQVHYMHASEGKEDYSGVRVASTIEPQPKTAATLLVVTGGKSNQRALKAWKQPVWWTSQWKCTHLHSESIPIAMARKWEAGL